MFYDSCGVSCKNTIRLTVILTANTACSNNSIFRDAGPLQNNALHTKPAVLSDENIPGRIDAFSFRIHNTEGVRGTHLNAMGKHAVFTDGNFCALIRDHMNGMAFTSVHGRTFSYMNGIAILLNMVLHIIGRAPVFDNNGVVIAADKEIHSAQVAVGADNNAVIASADIHRTSVSVHRGMFCNSYYIILSGNVYSTRLQKAVCTAGEGVSCSLQCDAVSLEMEARHGQDILLQLKLVKKSDDTIPGNGICFQ